MPLLSKWIQNTYRPDQKVKWLLFTLQHSYQVIYIHIHKYIYEYRWSHMISVIPIVTYMYIYREIEVLRPEQQALEPKLISR